MDASDPLTANEALSGIFGSISLSSWVFLLVRSVPNPTANPRLTPTTRAQIPQLHENYTTQSASGVSILFLLIWAAGDLFNLLGALWARLVPTVIALAFYFTVSDSVLILQCLYYNHFAQRTKADAPAAFVGAPGQPREEAEAEEAEEDAPLLSRRDSNRSFSSIGLPGSHLNRQRSASGTLSKVDERPSPRPRTLRAALFNTACILGVCAVGTLGWAIAYRVGAWVPAPPEGQQGEGEQPTPWAAEVLGYLSAALYLGARVPQIYKNWSEKSCEGLSLLFFMLSLLGNVSYGAGILAHSLQREYVVRNVPWYVTTFFLSTLKTRLGDETDVC